MYDPGTDKAVHYIVTHLDFLAQLLGDPFSNLLEGSVNFNQAQFPSPLY